MQHLVRTPHGVCVVTLRREGLALEERGGFDARWAEAQELSAGEPLGEDAYRNVVKAHLAEVYRAQNGREPGSIALNLASHQLIDDLNGWTKLNWRPD